jgi:hypothetical protein
VNDEINELLAALDRGELTKDEVLEQFFFLVGRYDVDAVAAALPAVWRAAFVTWVRQNYDNPTPVEDLVYIGNAPERPEMRPIIRELRAWLRRSDGDASGTSTAKRVSVVELRIYDGTKYDILARFVHASDGSIVTVALSEHDRRIADNTIRNGLPGPNGTMVRRNAGLRFLELLAPNFRGSEFFATRVFEMDEPAAMVIVPGPLPER